MRRLSYKMIRETISLRKLQKFSCCCGEDNFGYICFGVVYCTLYMEKESLQKVLEMVEAVSFLTIMFPFVMNGYPGIDDEVNNFNHLAGGNPYQSFHKKSR